MPATSAPRAAPRSAPRRRRRGALKSLPRSPLKRSPASGHPWIAQIDRLQSGFTLTQIQLADRLLHVSPRSLALWKAGRSPNPAVIIRLTELNRLYLALARLMPPSDVGPWMNRTNDYLDPLTPLEVLARGQIDLLWQIIHNVGSGMPT